MNLQQQDNYTQQVSHVARKSEDVHGFWRYESAEEVRMRSGHVISSGDLTLLSHRLLNKLHIRRSIAMHAQYIRSLLQVG